MGKCLSTASELQQQESGGSNTEQLISPDVTARGNNNENNIRVMKEDETENENNTNDGGNNGQMTSSMSGPTTAYDIDPNRNAGSLSESEDDETTQDHVRKSTSNDSNHKGISPQTQNNKKGKKEIVEEIKPDLNYIEASMEELEEQQELELAHISHRGHYLNDCKYSAQNLLQENETSYRSLKGYHFNSYENDGDW
eukprot:CAMPEP_0201596882 /NCGR_PEP_ID=MMETSP0190_2-20130828/193478_1 /ASSEMBLY_ACC=CAM_ASM_000263 /TAXON_ID=37353 /ORGANISM="Rosalina sp." /LENGTH=196 /DNA_ID=CAMNT_0048057495 /DNA_START=17 /DNA_END=604 /DNA_ORIENTATION=+